MSRYGLLFISASLITGVNSAAFASGWDPVPTGDPRTETVYTADTAGKSGNVKACYQSTCTYQDYTWTQQSTGKTRGTFTTSSCSDTTQVDNSNCE